MNLTMKRVGECVTLEASGTPEEIAEYTRLAGLVPVVTATSAQTYHSCDPHFGMSVDESGNIVRNDTIKSFMVSLGFAADSAAITSHFR